MTIDRYTKTILTVIAAALLYLCVVMTPLPAAQAQSARPGEISDKPLPVVITGWNPGEPMRVMVSNDVLRVMTEQAPGAADRVVLAGWEQNGSRDKGAVLGTFRPFPPVSNPTGLPVQPR